MAVAPLFRALLRPRLAPPARAVHSHPPESPVGPLETVVSLGIFFVALLGPAGWIVAHLDSYKKRD